MSNVGRISQAIWTERSLYTFRRNFIRLIEWVCISVILEAICSDEELYNLWYLTIEKKKTRQRVFLVATLDAMRETTVSGDRPGTIPLRTCAALSSSFCHFTNATGDPNLGATAKTVRPREKSFITAISRFQYPAQKKNMNYVRGQKMSEITLLSFLIFPRIGFLRFAEKLRGVGKNDPPHRICISKADLFRRKKIQKRVHFTPIFGKNPLLKKNFKTSFLGHLIRY